MLLSTSTIPKLACLGLIQPLLVLLLLTGNGLANAPTRQCDCSCSGYSELVESATEQSTERFQFIDQCGGACAIQWARCDSAQSTESSPHADPGLLSEGAEADDQDVTREKPAL